MTSPQARVTTTSTYSLGITSECVPPVLRLSAQGEPAKLALLERVGKARRAWLARLQQLLDLANAAVKEAHREAAQTVID